MEKIEKELRKLLCNETMDCENYPECPEGTNGCVVQNIINLYNGKYFLLKKSDTKVTRLSLYTIYRVKRGDNK